MKFFRRQLWKIKSENIKLNAFLKDQKHENQKLFGKKGRRIMSTENKLYDNEVKEPEMIKKSKVDVECEERMQRESQRKSQDKISW